MDGTKMESGIIQAIYAPNPPSKVFIFLEACIGNSYKFKFSYVLNGVKYYEPIDKNFPDSTWVSENDLQIESEVQS